MIFRFFFLDFTLYLCLYDNVFRVSSMRQWLFLLCSAPLLAASFGEGDKLYEAGEFKEAIEVYQTLQGRVEESQLKLRLCLAHYRDQDDVLAFTTYLEALEATQPKEAIVSQEEESVFEEGVAVYFSSFPTPRDEAIELAKRFGPIADEHPDWHLVNFLVSSAHANLGMFDDFFERFYRSYSHFPEHFLAHKIKGMLHVKLAERLSDEKVRMSEKARAVVCFEKAVQANPQDFSLYKMIVALSEDKRSVLVSTLENFIAKDVAIPRRDIYFYVEQALAAGEGTLAQNFVLKASQWYPVSRSVDAARELLGKLEENQ